MKELTPTEFIYEVARLEAIASGRRIVPEIWEVELVLKKKVK